MLTRHLFYRLVAATMPVVALCMFLAATPAQEMFNKDGKDGKEGKDVKIAKEIPVKDNAPSIGNLVTAGYSRPTNIEDQLNKDGKIIPAAFDPDLSEDELIGGTVYFAVYRLDRDRNQIMDREASPLIETFVPGRSILNTFSPEFDRQGKYLYLYQIVNDRGVVPGDIKFVANKDANVSDISSFQLKLIVDPRYITSWGYFKGAGFNLVVPDKDFEGGLQGAALGKDDKEAKQKDIRLAVSASPAITTQLPFQRFRPKCPAYSLEELKPTLGLGPVNQNLKQSLAYKQVKDLAAKRIQPANWEEGLIESGERKYDNQVEPDFVQVLYRGDFQDDHPPTMDKDLGYSIFRVEYTPARALKVGRQSVVFGFTADLPPTVEPVRIDGPKRKVEQLPLPPKKAAQVQVSFQQDEDEQFVQQGQGQAPAPAPGNAPAPAPSATANAPTPVPAGTPPGVTSPTLGGGATRPGGAAPGVPNALGTPSTPGSGGGFGGGQGSGGGEGQGQNGQQAGVVVNFNASLVNQQSQAQQQAQLQAQGQFQFQSQKNINRPGKPGDHGCPCDHAAVPAPAGWLLGALGLPALAILRRRKNQAIPPTIQ